MGAVKEGVVGGVGVADVGEDFGPHHASSGLVVGAFEVGEAGEVVAFVVSILHGQGAAEEHAADEFAFGPRIAGGKVVWRPTR